MANLGQFSFLLALALGAGVIISQTWSHRRLRVPGVLAALALIASWWLLRPGAGGAATAAGLQAALARGRPVVVEVYSDY